MNSSWIRMYSEARYLICLHNPPWPKSSFNNLPFFAMQWIQALTSAKQFFHGEKIPCHSGFSKAEVQISTAGNQSRKRTCLETELRTCWNFTCWIFERRVPSFTMVQSIFKQMWTCLFLAIQANPGWNKFLGCNPSCYYAKPSDDAGQKNHDFDKHRE